MPNFSAIYIYRYIYILEIMCFFLFFYFLSLLILGSLLGHGSIFTVRPKLMLRQDGSSDFAWHLGDTFLDSGACSTRKKRMTTWTYLVGQKGSLPLQTKCISQLTLSNKFQFTIKVRDDILLKMEEMMSIFQNILIFPKTCMSSLHVTIIYPIVICFIVRLSLCMEH